MKEVIKLKKDGSIEFETIKSHKNRLYFLCGFVCVVVLLVVFIVTRSHAKYRVTQSIPLVNGTINYSLPDLNIIGLYIDGEEADKLDSSKTYTLDTTQSTCTYKDGSIIPNLTISYNSETGGLSISPYTTKGTKCTLYFNEQVSASDTILANYSTVKTRTFPLTTSSTVTETTTGTIYKSADSNQYDNDGEIYYFAGNPTDNWVKWAGFYWRIIRINGNGSIRMIYQGTSPNTTGTNTQLQTSAFNSSYVRSEYVGIKYTSGQQHGQNTNSTIMGVLNTWYNSKLASYADDIDTNVGFCSDRNLQSGSWSSTGSHNYAAYGRLVSSSSNVNPSFKCSNSSDLLKIPVGLITADEVVMAGLSRSGSTTSNYLYTNQNYWTMSPCNAVSVGWANVFGVNSSGRLYIWGVYDTLGVRPVVNLKSSVQITRGDGSSGNPYVISD